MSGFMGFTPPGAGISPLQQMMALQLAGQGSPQGGSGGPGQAAAAPTGAQGTPYSFLVGSGAQGSQPHPPVQPAPAPQPQGAGQGMGQGLAQLAQMQQMRGQQPGGINAGADPFSLRATQAGAQAGTAGMPGGNWSGGMGSNAPGAPAFNPMAQGPAAAPPSGGFLQWLQGLMPGAGGGSGG